jgi:hypothetical protein
MPNNFRKPQTAGIISAGLSLLVTGLITAMDDDATKHNFNNNQIQDDTIYYYRVLCFIMWGFCNCCIAS